MLWSCYVRCRRTRLLIRSHFLRLQNTENLVEAEATGVVGVEVGQVGDSVEMETLEEEEVGQELDQRSLVSKELTKMPAKMV